MQRIKNNPMRENFVQKKFYKEACASSTLVRKPIAGVPTNALGLACLCAIWLAFAAPATAQTPTADPAASTVNKDLVQGLRDKKWSELSEAERTRLLRSRYTNWNMMALPERNSSMEEFRRQWESGMPENRENIFLTPSESPRPSSGQGGSITPGSGGVGNSATPGNGGAGGNMTPGTGGVGGSATPSGRR